MQVGVREVFCLCTLLFSSKVFGSWEVAEIEWENKNPSLSWGSFVANGMCRYTFSQTYHPGEVKLNVTFDKFLTSYDDYDVWQRLDYRPGIWYFSQSMSWINPAIEERIMFSVKWSVFKGRERPNGFCICNAGVSSVRAELEAAMAETSTTSTTSTKASTMTTESTTTTESTSTTVTSTPSTATATSIAVPTTPSTVSPTIGRQDPHPKGCTVQATHSHVWTHEMYITREKCTFDFDYAYRIPMGTLKVNVTFDKPVENFDDFGLLNRVESHAGVWYYGRSKWILNPGAPYDYEFNVEWREGDVPMATCYVDFGSHCRLNSDTSTTSTTTPTTTTTTPTTTTTTPTTTTTTPTTTTTTPTTTTTTPTTTTTTPTTTTTTPTTTTTTPTTTTTTPTTTTTTPTTTTTTPTTTTTTPTTTTTTPTTKTTTPTTTTTTPTTTTTTPTTTTTTPTTTTTTPTTTTTTPTTTTTTPTTTTTTPTTTTTTPTTTSTTPTTTTTTPTTTTPGFPTFRYTNVIDLSMDFYAAQRSGALPDNRIPWRGDSALGDSGTNGEDLTGGYYDAGDHVKFNLPMAASMTLLAYGQYIFADAYEDFNLDAEMRETIKWGLDYFLKCWRPSDFNPEYYAQVANAYADHAFWGRAEEMAMPRPAYKVTLESYGSDVSAETASAFAAGYLVFKDTDPDYAARLLDAAKSLYKYADDYRGIYSDAIFNAQGFYPSAGYNDELMLGAIMLYTATGDETYKTKAMSFFSATESSPWALSWGDKNVLAQLLLYNITRDDMYKGPVQDFLMRYRGDVPSVVTFVDGVLAFRSEWAPNRYAANAAFVAVLAAEVGIDPDRNVKWAQTQIDYLLGNNKDSFSYVIGFGSNYPLKPRHRGSSCPDLPADCDNDELASPLPNPQILYGALVGGPQANGVFVDDRNNFRGSEVACDYNAGFTSALAGLTHFRSMLV